LFVVSPGSGYHRLKRGQSRRECLLDNADTWFGVGCYWRKPLNSQVELRPMRIEDYDEIRILWEAESWSAMGWTPTGVHVLIHPTAWDDDSASA